MATTSRSLFLLLLVPYAAASAAPSSVCEPLANLSSQVNYCDENFAYVAPAKKCFEAFRKQVDAENKKIRKVLDSNVKNAKGSEQDADFETTQTVLASAEATLTGLLEHGKRAFTEIEDYGYDMVLPIYEAYPEDYDLSPWSKEGRKIFREKNCYGEPMQDLDAIKAKMRPIIAELEKTKAKVVSLHKVSGYKKTDLGSVTPAPPASDSVGQGSAVPAVKEGKSRNQGSTITGVEQDKKKSRQKGK